MKASLAQADGWVHISVTQYAPHYRVAEFHACSSEHMTVGVKKREQENGVSPRGFLGRAR